MLPGHSNISHRGRALVIGGSMSGLFAGLLLRKAGWDVDIFERVEGELSGRGAGIVAQPDLIAALESLALVPQDLGVGVETRRVFASAGCIVVEGDCPQVMTAWERVYRLLRDAFPPERYHRGKALQAFQDRGASVTALFNDGSRVEADLLIGADGLRSTVRQQCLPGSVPLYAGYVAWRALIDERVLSSTTHRDLFPYMAFCLPPGEQMLGYPVAGPDNDLRPGHRRYNMVWYRPADEATDLVRLLTDGSGITHAISIPPHLIRKACLDEMRAEARRLLSPQFVEIVEIAEQPLLQPIYDLESPRMAFGRVALIGDAAFVARPHVGAGVTKAAEDARELVHALSQSDDVPEALSQFEQSRLRTGRRIIERARHLGAYLQARQHTEEERSRSAQHSIPEAVMIETATLDFLHS
jgi:2-polyprenyl-6-methoxyphenol hydroxylase-like FAD-dependent oxidoreductase